MPSDELLSIVIPAYRSEGYLERTIGELVVALEPHGDFEIVVVNDGSPDEVQAVIDRLSSSDPRVRGIALGRNHGQHVATLVGFAATRGDVVVTLDDDGQNPPSACLAVSRALREEGHDVVYGRFAAMEQHGVRRLASRLNRWISAQTIGNRGTAISNVRALDGELARALGRCESPFPYIDAMIFRSTRNIGEVEVEHRARAAGQSTYRFGTLLRLWVSHVTSLTVLPLRVATAGSFAASLLGLVIGLVQMVRALSSQRAPDGWLSLFVAMTFLFSVLFAFLGIVSAYLGRMYVSLNQRGLIWARTRRRRADRPSRTARSAAR